MKIEVLFFGQLRELTEVTKSTAEIKENASLADLTDYLEKAYGADFRNQVSGTRGMRILVNGQEYTLLGGMETPLREGDTVVFMPPIFGG